MKSIYLDRGDHWRRFYYCWLLVCDLEDLIFNNPEIATILHTTEFLDLNWSLLESVWLREAETAVFVYVAWVTDWEVIRCHEIQYFRFSTESWTQLRWAVRCFVWVSHIHLHPWVDSKQETLVTFVRFEPITKPTQRSIGSNNLSKLIFGQNQSFLKSITTLMKIFSLEIMLTCSKCTNKWQRFMQLLKKKLMIKFLHFFSNNSCKHFHLLTWVF